MRSKRRPRRGDPFRFDIPDNHGVRAPTKGAMTYNHAEAGNDTGVKQPSNPFQNVLFRSAEVFCDTQVGTLYDR